MIFLGDVAHPFKRMPLWPRELDIELPKVVNMEGAVIANASPKLKNDSVLFNDISIVGTLIENNVVAACLANNHINDLDEGVASTTASLQGVGIQPFGAYGSTDTSVDYEVVEYDGQVYALLAFGWHVIQCKPLGLAKAGVKPLASSFVLASVKKARKDHPNAIVVCNFHWNYELELYPQPSHRKLAMDCIDLGADLIIGHHPHVVGGIETYKGVPIVYSLGNWWLPQGEFFDGKLSYPSNTYTQLAFEFSAKGEHICHWFEYKPQGHKIEFIKKELLADSQKVVELTPFAGMSHEDYYKWFKKNRIKKKLLPIYKVGDSKVTIKLKDLWVKIRHPLILILKKVIG